jgi:hypothetical protein
MAPNELAATLAGFTGTMEHYRHWTGHLVYTDGVKFLAENAGHGAYWLLDAIASYQPECQKDAMLRDFQVWTLTVAPNKSAVLKCERDTNDVALTQTIEFTDSPLPEIKLYVQNGVLMLPSEY